MAEELCTIGEGIQIRGSLTGSGDLLVLGRIEGQVTLDNHLTVESSGMVVADIAVQSVTINGAIEGDVVASDIVAINAGAKMHGDIRAQEIEIADGAIFRGKLDMDVPLPDDL